MSVICEGEVMFDSEWGWFHVARGNGYVEQFRLLRGERIAIRKHYRALRKEGVLRDPAHAIAIGTAEWSVTGLQTRFV